MNRAKFAEEVFGNRQDVFATIAERGQGHLHDRHAVIEVRADRRARGAEPLHPVRRRDQAYVDGPLLHVADGSAQAREANDLGAELYVGLRLVTERTCRVAFYATSGFESVGGRRLAEISAKRHRYDESLEYCQKAERLAPYTHPAKVLLAVFCCANGDQERGLKLLREARTEAPYHPIPALILGQLARQQQQG